MSLHLPDQLNPVGLLNLEDPQGLLDPLLHQRRLLLTDRLNLLVPVDP